MSNRRLASRPIPRVPVLLTREQILATRHGERIEGCALVLRSEPATDRVGRLYLRLSLRGADGGLVEARWWRYPYPAERRPQAGQCCWFAGTTETYAGEAQLQLTEGRPAPEVDATVFARATRRSPTELEDALEQRLAALPPAWQALTRAVLSGETRTRFLTWPAAQLRHGAVRHGLLAHSLRVAQLAEALANAYGHTHLPHDPALVVVGALLHDVGKVQTLPAVAGGPLPLEAQAMDHVTAGVLLVQCAATEVATLPQEQVAALLHILLAHHGRLEWKAPIEPQSVEAWLVHLADYAEAHLWGWSDEEASWARAFGSRPFVTEEA